MNGRKKSILPLESSGEEDSEYDFKLFKSYKSKDKYKIDYFEKLKPETKVNKEVNEKNLKTAENQIKKILSNYFKTNESENIESDIGFKQISSSNYNSSVGKNSTKKKEIKTIRTINSRKNKNENSYKGNNKSIGKDILINKFLHIPSASPIKKFKNLNSNRTLKHKSKKYTHKSYKNVKFFDEEKNNEIQHHKLFLEGDKNTNGQIQRFYSLKTRKESKDNSNSLKNNELNIKSSFKKTRTQKQHKNHISFKDIKYINNPHNIKEKIKKKFLSNGHLISIKNNNNKLGLPIREKKCKTPLSKRASLFKKQQIMANEGKNDIKSETENIRVIHDGNNNFKRIVSFEKHNCSDIGIEKSNKISKNENKKKFINLISNFKLLKHKIRQSIILRPEEVEGEIKRDSKKDLYKKNQSNSNRMKIASVNETPKKNTEFSDLNAVGIHNVIQNQSLGNKTENNLINIEKDTKPIIAKKATKKSVSFNEEYPFHEIKRKSIITLDKFRKIIHKGPIYDSLDDEELEDEEEINRFYLDPNSYFCFYFDLILFIINIITFIEIPLYLAMNLNFCRNHRYSFDDIVNMTNELINILDFIFGFFRAFYNWDEQLIKKNDIIIKKYLLSWCLFDLISAFPVYSLIKIFEPLCDNISKSLYYNYILDNTYYLLICNRLFKLLKIFSKNQAWKYISNKLSDFLGLIFSICLIIFALNYTACLYIFIARNSYPNWILKAGIKIDEFKNIYICAIYVLIMTLTTVGYGDITCCSLKERIFQVVLLIIGIMAYSWLISSFSSFIKKINEKTVEYEKKKSILDEIKSNNPNLSDDLYEKVLKYLNFKHFHEKNVKNNIFDCLPLGLKNNLIYEMYKPIIKNFIFFKNFQNTDFIVQVITCFKPILAYKNYILVNEGDLIEDIIFVKHGVLSVELPLNITNLQENIDKYLTTNKPNKNKEQSQLKNTLSKIRYDTFSSFIGEGPKKLNSLAYDSTINSSFKYKSTFLARTTLAKVKTIKEEKVYVKILGIRDNEHFGDVLMFLEERSPLQVRVRSKKCELFFLKKIDALKISSSYSNIWRRINKKSVYNFQQIKKNIRKIVEIYCSVKENNNEDKEEDDIDDEFGLKKCGIGEHNKNYDLNNSALNSSNNYIKENKYKSEEKIENKANYSFYKKYGLDDNYFNDSKIKNQKFSVKRSHSIKIFKTDFESLFFQKNQFSFSDSSSSSEIKPKKKKKKKKKIKNRKNSFNKKLTKKILDVFNHNYTYYKDINKKNNNDHSISIIAEETDKDLSISKMMNNGNNDSTHKNSINSKNKILEMQSIDSIKKKEIKKHNKRKSTGQKDKQSLFGLSNININNNYETKKNREILINSSEDCDSQINDEHIINNEIYPGEKLQIDHEENLLNKKINNDDIKKYDVKNYFNINFNIEQNNRNNDLAKLLKYFEKESKSCHKYHSHKESLCNKSSSHFSRKTINSNNLVLHHEMDSSDDTSKNDVYLDLKTNWDSNLFSINNDISLTINSSYENSNIISGGKLIKSKNLQNKLKEYLIKESYNITNDIIKIDKNNEIKKNKTSFKNKRHNERSILNNSTKKKMASSIVLNTTNINYINNISLMKNKTKKLHKSNSTKNVKNYLLSNTSIKKSPNHLTTIVKKNIDQTKNDNKFTEIECFSTSKNYMKFKNKIASKNNSQSFINSSNFFKHLNIYHNKSFNKIDNSNTRRAFNFGTSKELPRRYKIKSGNSFLISSTSSKGKKRKDNLLTQIGYNIKTTNQKLNEPEVFYNNYFSNILKEKMKEKNK